MFLSDYQSLWVCWASLFLYVAVGNTGRSFMISRIITLILIIILINRTHRLLAECNCQVEVSYPRIMAILLKLMELSIQRNTLFQILMRQKIGQRKDQIQALAELQSRLLLLYYPSRMMVLQFKQPTGYIKMLEHHMGSALRALLKMLPVMLYERQK